jgi:hypothetical protein
MSFRLISNNENMTDHPDHPALSITSTDVEKVLDRNDIKVKPRIWNK